MVVETTSRSSSKGKGEEEEEKGETGYFSGNPEVYTVVVAAGGGAVLIWDHGSTTQ